MKENLKKFIYLLMMTFMASSFDVYAINSFGPGDSDNTTVTTPDIPPVGTLASFGMPSPTPIKAEMDHAVPATSVSRPVLTVAEPSRFMVNAAPIAMSSKAMPATFKGVAQNEILGSENLNAIFNEIAKGQRTIKILQIGDSHVRGNIYPQTIQKALESKLNAERRAISFDYMGVNGARASKFTGEDFQSKIAAKRPDLVIISFGTNEAHGNFSSSSNTRVMESLVNGIRHRNPNVTFLITTTPGSYISRGGSKVINKTHEDVAQNLLEFGRNHGIAVWDLYHNIGGNENACRNLINAGMMQGDRIHLTAAGYRMIGNMFAEAFINAYNRFLTR